MTNEERAEDPASFYCTIFPEARIKHAVPYPEVVELELFGQTFVPCDGVTVVVPCDSQDQIDHCRDALITAGGELGAQGLLTDKFGVSWRFTLRVRSTESHGLGQSGYTAGRDRDAALDREVVTDYVVPHDDRDEDERVRADLSTDNRFTGR